MFPYISLHAKRYRSERIYKFAPPSTAYNACEDKLAWFAWTFATMPEKSPRTLRRFPLPPGMISRFRIKVLNISGNSTRNVPASTCNKMDSGNGGTQHDSCLHWRTKAAGGIIKIAHFAADGSPCNNPQSYQARTTPIPGTTTTIKPPAALQSWLAEPHVVASSPTPRNIKKLFRSSASVSPAPPPPLLPNAVHATICIQQAAPRAANAPSLPRIAGSARFRCAGLRRTEPRRRKTRVASLPGTPALSSPAGSQRRPQKSRSNARLTGRRS